MAHLLISQNGDRFTYSHEFSNINLRNMENVLEEKEEEHFRLRRNWNDVKKKNIAWAECVLSLSLMLMSSQSQVLTMMLHALTFALFMIHVKKCLPVGAALYQIVGLAKWIELE